MVQQQPVKWSPNPTKVDPKATEVVMNGTKYVRSDSVCAARWPYLQQYEAQLIHGQRADQLHKVLVGDLKKALNELRLVDASVLVHNLANDVAQITDVKRLPAAFALTMLFWNYEGEDVSVFDDTVMKRKMEDARLSGIDAAFFFSQPARCIEGYLSLLDPTRAQPDGSASKEIQVSMTSPVHSTTS